MVPLAGFEWLGRSHAATAAAVQRRAKEQAMHERFERRIEAGLEKISISCGRCRHKPAVIGRRIGRRLERSSRKGCGPRLTPGASGRA